MSRLFQIKRQLKKVPFFGWTLLIKITLFLETVTNLQIVKAILRITEENHLRNGRDSWSDKQVCLLFGTWKCEALLMFIKQLKTTPARNVGFVNKAGYLVFILFSMAA